MLTARIDGQAVPLPAYVERDWTIRHNLGSIPNEARLKIRDDDMMYEPPELALLEMTNEAGQILFDGLITSIDILDTAIGRTWDIVASGWTWDLDRRIVQGATYLTVSDQYIISTTTPDKNDEGTIVNPVGILKLTDEGRPGVYDTTNVDASPVLQPSFQFEGDSVRSILDELSRGSGYIYWIDPGRRLNYQLPQNLSHSNITLSDNEAIGTRPRRFRVRNDLTQLITRVLVIGGFGIRPKRTSDLSHDIKPIIVDPWLSLDS